MASKIPARLLSKSLVLLELEDAIREYRPILSEGFFFTSNSVAFKIASDIKSGLLTEPKREWVEAIDQAIEDLLEITSSGRRTVKSLADLEVSLNEILANIQTYDNLTI
jgi:hypothetical protein